MVKEIDLRGYKDGKKLPVVRKRSNYNIDSYRSVFDLFDSMLREFTRPFSLFKEDEFDNLFAFDEDLGIREPVTYFKDLGDKYLIEFEVPGLNKDELDLELVDDTLIVKGKKKETGDNYFREVNYEKRVKLPEDVNLDSVNAKLDNGILRITIDKTCEKKGKRIDIN